MAQVRLRKDFYGSLIPKVSSDSLLVTVKFDYKGPAQTLEIETNTGKRGLYGDYDQESPTYYDSKAVTASDTLKSYTFSRSIPLSFWGDRQIDDGAVEVVIRGDGVYDDAVLWDAYTVNPAAVGISFYVRPWGITDDCPNPKAWCCYYWDPGINSFVGDGSWHNLPDTRQFENVQPGGYLSAFYLDYNGAVSRQYNSQVFNPINGATYQFDLATGYVYKV